MTKFNVYYCKICNVKFAVDQEFQNKPAISCPLCTSFDIDDAGEAIEDYFPF